MSSEHLIIAIAIFTAISVYMVAGFGFALVAMPLLTLAVPIERAIVVLALLSIATTGLQGWTLRAHVRRALARRLVLAAYVGMPVGLVILNTVDESVLLVVLGVGVVTATVLLATDVTLDHVGPGMDHALGFLSGVANTSIGTNGPPLVFDLQSRRLAPDEFRATMAVVFTLGNLFTLALFVLDGKITRDGATSAIVALPALVLGTVVGRLLQPRVPTRHFRTLVLGLLLVTGMLTVARAL